MVFSAPIFCRSSCLVQNGESHDVISRKRTEEVHVVVRIDLDRSIERTSAIRQAGTSATAIAPSGFTLYYASSSIGTFTSDVQIFLDTRKHLSPSVTIRALYAK